MIKTFAANAAASNKTVHTMAAATRRAFFRFTALR